MTAETEYGRKPRFKSIRALSEEEVETLKTGKPIENLEDLNQTPPKFGKRRPL